MKVGEKIRQIRVKKGIGIRSLEEKTGISRKNLSGYELGKTNPAIPTLQKIAKALECKISDFLN